MSKWVTYRKLTVNPGEPVELHDNESARASVVGNRIQVVVETVLPGPPLFLEESSPEPEREPMTPGSRRWARHQAEKGRR